MSKFNTEIKAFFSRLIFFIFYEILKCHCFCKRIKNTHKNNIIQKQSSTVWKNLDENLGMFCILKYIVHSSSAKYNHSTTPSFLFMLPKHFFSSVFWLPNFGILFLEICSKNVVTHFLCFLSKFIISPV